MGKLKKFAIIFDQNRNVYFVGDEVKGICLLELTGELKLTEIRIHMKGSAQVHWTESRSSGNRLGAYTDHFNAEIEYFSLVKTLFQTENASSTTLSPGVHQFKFSFTLPPSGISTSFESKFASIRYWLKAEVERSWSLNLKTKKNFTVMNRIDVNRPEFRSLVESSVEQRLYCWCFISGPISLHVRTDRKGYCPGESIAITARFENNSNRSLTPTVSLYQTQTASAGGKCMLRKFKLTSITGLVIDPRSSVEWDAIPLKVPAVSPTINNCCLIRVEYFVRVVLEVRGGKNLTTDLPIIVGTVPFRTNSTNCNQLPPPPAVPCRTVALPPEAPPSYTESVVSSTPDSDINGLTFCPSYTFVGEFCSGSSLSVPDDPPAYSEVDPNPIVLS